MSKEVMRLAVGSILHPGVEIWYKGERKFWVEGDMPCIVGIPIKGVLHSGGVALSIAVEAEHGKARG